MRAGARSRGQQWRRQRMRGRQDWRPGVGVLGLQCRKPLDWGEAGAPAAGSARRAPLPALQAGKGGAPRCRCCRAVRWFMVGAGYQKCVCNSSLYFGVDVPGEVFNDSRATRRRRESRSLNWALTYRLRRSRRSGTKNPNGESVGFGKGAGGNSHKEKRRLRFFELCYSRAVATDRLMAWFLPFPSHTEFARVVRHKGSELSKIITL